MPGVRRQDAIRSWAARFWYPAALVAVTVGFFAQQLIGAAGHAIGTLPVLGGDPWVYLDRWEDIRSGLIPYTQMEFEHLPLSIVPIVLAGLVADFTGIPYWNTFTGVAIVMTLATTFAVQRTGLALDDDSVVARFLLLTIPLLPLVLFRVDLLPVMCVAFAMFAWISGRDRSGRLWAMGGILAKGWPMVLVATEWWRGRRARATGLLSFTVAMVLGLVLLPGFQSGRSFTGIHLETVVGSLLLIGRQVTGAELGTLPDAGALYIEAAPWMVVVNALFGLGFAAWALRALKGPFSWERANLLAAALTLAMILASPIFSPQFLIWPVVFLAISPVRRSTGLFLAVALVSLLYVGFWDHTAYWWSIVLLGRNVLFVILVAVVAGAAAKLPPTPRSPSREVAGSNLGR